MKEALDAYLLKRGYARKGAWRKSGARVTCFCTRNGRGYFMTGAAVTGKLLIEIFVSEGVTEIPYSGEA